MIAAPSALPETIASGSPRTARRRTRGPDRILVWALGLLVLFAGFDHGAVGVAAQARIQVAVSLGTAVVAGLVFGGVLELRMPRLAWVAVAALAGFVAWGGLSLAWSVAPDATWTEFNRWATYLLLVLVAIVAGASSRHAASLTSDTLLAAVAAVTAYGLAQKVIPEVHVGGLFDLNQTGAVPRLQEPLGYWNALSLLVTLGVPTAVARASDPERSTSQRLISVLLLEAMVLTIAFTFSRGGLLALAVAMVVFGGLAGHRLRLLLWTALAVIGALPALVFGLTAHALTVAGASLASRESAGAILFAAMLIGAAVAVLLALRVISLETTVHLSRARALGIARLLAAAVTVLLLVGVIGVAVSSRGLTGTISHAWHTFTATRAASNYDPNRLLSVDSENRWVWWKEAAGAFSDRPLQGWGAGSFATVHLLYRRDGLTVSEAHSMPLQLLSETGLIGALLALVAFAGLGTVALRFVRTRTDSRERLVGAALFAAVTAFAVHALYDWDWDIPGVTLPALIMLGVLVGAAGRSNPREHATVRPPRLWLLSGVALLLCTVAASGVLPSLAQDQADQALVDAASGSATALTQAQHEAVMAARLDPLSDAGPLAEEAVALRRHDLRAARADLLAAVARDPTDTRPWADLGVLASSLGDLRDATVAVQRVLTLDPHRSDAAALAAEFGADMTRRATPPAASPTAQPVVDQGLPR